MDKQKYDTEAMRAYKAEGHTNKEVSERFCCSYGYAKQICKGIASQKNQDRDYCQREQRAIEMIQSRVPDYEYVGGFKGSEDEVILKCKHCGDVVKRSMISIRHRKLKCQRCDAIKRNAEQERKNQERKEEQAERERLKRIEKYKNTKRIQVQAQSCSICGGLFIPKTSRSKTCSKECRNRFNNRRKDKRIAKDKMIDKDITLEKLYIRDDGVCKLCGGMCDWNDEPNKIDSKYPSVDHIIPIADGGEHSWDNVQLAHWYCNTVRRNAPLSEMFEQI